MNKVEVCGGKKLDGMLEIKSAKNAVLPLIASSILTDEKVILRKVPRISDMDKMLQILTEMGGLCVFCEGNVILDNSLFNKFEIPKILSSQIRSSIFMLGPLLAKFGVAQVVYPGGCDIGSRPIDLHLSGLRNLNVKIVEEHGVIYCNGKNMKSGIVHLDFPSVGATENLMMASVFLKGETVILNSAKEPEIVDLANFINKMGGRISGAGTSTIKIKGVRRLRGVDYTPISDRISAGTFLIACAMTGGKILLENCNFEHNYSLIVKLRNSGCQVVCESDKIYLQSRNRLKSIPTIDTQPFPGFPTDLQAQALAMQTISRGTSIVTENLYENRFNHVPELIKMGANILLRDRMAIVRGVKFLQGAELTCSDLRGGAGLVLAGLVAKGVSHISNMKFIDRGYEDFEGCLVKLGADIKRLT